MKKISQVLLLSLSVTALAHAERQTEFTNPLYQAEDPWVVFHGGYYYVCTSGPLDPKAVYVSKSKTLIERGEKVRVWDGEGEFNRVFAPELQFIDGKWYIYFCADAKESGWKHMAVVLEANTDDPLDGFTSKGVLFTGDERGNAQANDFTTVMWNGQLYAFWGSLGDKIIRNAVMAPMDSPTKITAHRKETSLHAEGPRAIVHDGKLIMTGSEGPFASKAYRLSAMIHNPETGTIDDRDSWKYLGTLLKSTDDVWGPARASFTTSADGSQFWTMYHSKIFPADDNGIRAANIKPFTFKPDGTPVFGKPPGPSEFLKNPPGDPGLGELYPVENWQLDGGAAKATTNRNFTGTGYVDGFGKPGAAATFEVEVPEAGVYRVVFRYANGVKIANERKSHPTAYPPATGSLTLYVNGEKIRRSQFHRTTSWDVWMLHGENIALKAGKNRIGFRAEEGDNGEVAFDHAALRKAGIGQRGLTGTYFNDRDLKEKKLTRLDPELAFNWGEGSPDPLIGPNTFSVRWEGFIIPLYSETYTFHAKSDNGRRLKIDGQMLIDEWTDAHDLTPTGTIALEAGKQYPIVYEYYEDGGGANTRLEWSSQSQQREVVPSARLRPNKGG